MGQVKLANGELRPLREAHLVGSVAGVDLRITHPCVSKRHAELRWLRDRWAILSFGANGTTVNGAAVPDKDLRPLREGDVLEFGVPDARIELVDAGPPGPIALHKRDGRWFDGDGVWLGLPSAEDPAVTVRADGGAWVADVGEAPPLPIADGDEVESGGDRWTVYVPTGDNTIPTPEVHRLTDATAILTNRRNEAFAVELRWPRRSLDLREYKSHELLWELAVALEQDRALGLDDVVAGWRTLDELVDLLGGEKNRLYGWIFQARRRAVAAGLADGKEIILGRDGGKEIRFGVDRFELRRP